MVWVVEIHAHHARVLAPEGLIYYSNTSLLEHFEVYVCMITFIELNAQ